MTTRISHRFRGAPIILAPAAFFAWLVIVSPTIAQVAATRPAGRDLIPAPADPGGFLIRPSRIVAIIRQAAATLELSDQQRYGVNATLNRAAQDAATLESQMVSMTQADRSSRASAFARTVGYEVAADLSDQQRQLLSQHVQAQIVTDAVAGQAGRVRSAILSLNLSADQLTQVRELATKYQQKIQETTAGIRDGSATLDDMRQASQDFHAQLEEILTPSQQDQLRTVLANGNGPAPNTAATRPSVAAVTPPSSPIASASPTARRPAGDGSAAGDEPAMAMMQNDSNAALARSAATGASAVNHLRGNPPAAAPAAAGSAPDVGSVIPDLRISRLDGPPVSLASMRGRVVVLTFGSYSCPSFRSRAPAMEQLNTEFGSRAAFFIVYTRESNPNGELQVERNRQDNVLVDAPSEFSTRRTLAMQARQSLNLRIPILVDTMDDTAANALGGFPNSTIVVSRDGHVVARQQWTDPGGLRPLLLEALNAPATQPAP